MEEGRGVPSKEIEPQRRAKVAKTTRIKSSSKGAPGDRGRDLRTKVPNWNPPLVLDGSLIPLIALIRDFQQGKVEYVANAVE